MSAYRIKIPALAATLVLLACPPGSPARADGGPAAVLYAGEALGQAASKISPWGGGAVSDTDQAAYLDGKRSLLVTTVGPYQGVAFTLNSPLVVGNVRTEKNHYLSLALAFSAAGPPAPVVVPKPRPKNGLPDQIGTLPRQGGLFHLAAVTLAQAPPIMGPGGPGMPGMPGMQGGPDTGNPAAAPVAPPPPSLNYLRVVITTLDGYSSECVRAIPPMQNGAWVTMGFPLSLFPLPDNEASSLTIQRVTVAGDTTAMVYLGSAKLTTDSDPITASILGDTDIQPGQPITYAFIMNAGSSNVRWEWKVDDGSPVEKGLTMTHTFAKAGVYHVTLTITDLDGLKAPLVVNTKVVAQEQ